MTKRCFSSSTPKPETFCKSWLPLSCGFHEIWMFRGSFADATDRTNRNWRYHKELRMWLTKDVSLGEPVQLSPEKEQGSYSFWNPQTWEKMRVSRGCQCVYCEGSNEELRSPTSSFITSNWHRVAPVRPFDGRISEGVGTDTVLRDQPYGLGGYETGWL